MTKDIIKQRFDDLLEYLPEKLKKPLITLEYNMKISTEEIRLRAGRPLSITVGGTQFFIKKDEAINCRFWNMFSIIYGHCFLFYFFIFF